MNQASKTYIKNNIGTVILLAVLAFFIFKEFIRKNDNPQGIKSSDTTRQVIYVQQPVQTIDRYVPISSGSAAPIVIPPQYNSQTSSLDLTELKQILQELATKHYSTNTYPDSIKLFDSTKTQVGVVNLVDKISENEIKSRDVNYQLKFPKETITITNTLYPKPVNQLYLGVGISGNQISPIVGAELSAILKSKKDNLYGLSGGINTQNLQPYIKASYLFKIRLGKK